jgi:cellulose synthase/poly-beta-1,6-N-acetylglucosamine synthase-like glycosyltransferase
MLILVPVVILFSEVLFAPRSRAEPGANQGIRPRLTVLMPAHNEQIIIAQSLAALAPQLTNSDRLLVVADNCTDDTASIAAAQGAEVIIRDDSNRRGKGFALDFGLRYLESDPTEVVLVIDADCTVALGAIDRLARLCTLFGRPVQALYLMRGAPNAGLHARVAEFAWTVKNHVRPLGLRRLGLPCQLMGTGMAFPWTSISSAALATSHIVEDLKLGIDLTLAGSPPLFCAEALVTSEFPASEDGVRNQRARWEHGHLSVIFKEAPRLFYKALRKLDGNSMALAFDLMVPPLALLMLLVGGVWAASAFLFIVAKAQIPLFIASIAGILLALSVFLSWARFGREIISLGSLAFAPIYALRKVPLYAKFLVARQLEWVRTKRN